MCNSQEIKITVTYKGKDYSFRSGSAAFIFQTGIFNGIGRQNTDVLLKYVDLVYDCYISDSNNTNLGSLADYIAKHWKSLQKADRYSILEKYYSEAEL